MLARFLPDIVGVANGFRKKFDLGLVRYRDESAGPIGANVISALDSGLKEEMAKLAKEKDFLGLSYLVHNSIGVSIDIATEVWAAGSDWESDELRMLSFLVDGHRQRLYGEKAVQKRISSAMLQTMHISASLEKFSFLLFADQNGKHPDPKTMRTLHQRNMKTGFCLTQLHLDRTREIRPVLGATTDGGIIHRYEDSSYFELADKRLELKEDALPIIMESRPISSSNGRIGCPGKRHVPEIWRWIEDVSRIYSYPALRT